MAARPNSLFKFSSMTSQLDMYRTHRIVYFLNRLTPPGLACANVTAKSSTGLDGLVSATDRRARGKYI